MTLAILKSPNNTEGRLGYNVPADWESALEILKTHKELKTDKPATAFYTNEFIPPRRSDPRGRRRDGLARAVSQDLRPRDRRRSHAFGPVDLEVGAGRFVALLGPSGAARARCS